MLKHNPVDLQHRSASEAKIKIDSFVAGKNSELSEGARLVD